MPSGPDDGAEHECARVGRHGVRYRGSTIARRLGALTGDRRFGEDRRVFPVGGDEVDQRFRVLEVLTEVGPVGVGASWPSLVP